MTARDERVESPAQIGAGALRSLIADLFPGSSLEAIRPLAPDAGERERAAGATEKGFGYGVPLRLTVRGADGRTTHVVLHTATANDFGHDRRADRAMGWLLAFDTFGSIPGHVRAIDVGAMTASGALRSLRDTGEYYLVTEFAEGEVYAADLRRIARERQHTGRDIARCEALAAHLALIHGDRGGRPAVYTRAIRDLVGHGEGIFGIIDGYPPDVPGAPPSRLRAIERRCADWRWRLRGREERLARTHGDVHPFNIVFDDRDQLTLLDASRGCRGDPADDVICLAINYVFFALMEPGAWRDGLGALWRRFWRRYLELTGDHELLAVAPPFLAWRALVLGNPRWYPAIAVDAREALLALAEGALDAGFLDLQAVEAMFS